MTMGRKATWQRLKKLCQNLSKETKSKTAPIYHTKRCSSRSKNTGISYLLIPLMSLLPSGEKIKIYPQRTNNLLERFFRELNRGSRKRNGCKSLGRTLQTMLSETPIVKNLHNPEYVEIILNGKISLAARFAEIDGAQIRSAMKNSQHQEEKLPVAVKKLIKIEGLPKQLLGLISKREMNIAAA